MRLHIPALTLALGLSFVAMPSTASADLIDLDPNAEAVPGEILTVLKVKNDAHQDKIESCVAKAMKLLDDVEYERVPYTNCFAFRRTSNVEAEATEDSLEDLAEAVEDALDECYTEIVAAEPNYVCQTPTGNPSNIRVLGNDPVSAVAGQAGFAGLDLPAVNAQSTGIGILVAVLDTGVDSSHPLLSGRVSLDGFDLVDGDLDPSEERDGVDQDADGFPDRDYGHGTFVSSMILAVAPDAEILPIRLLDAEGHGDLLNLAGGIIYAVEHGADVINISASIEGPSEVLDAALDVAAAMNVIVVASAGNDGETQVAFPARHSSVLAVTAADSADVVPGWASIGTDVNFVAPGVDLIGAFPMDLNTYGTAVWSGTSFSAPLAAGSLAALYAANPWTSATQIIDALEDSALNINNLNPGKSGKLGSGRIRPALAFDEL